MDFLSFSKRKKSQSARHKQKLSIKWTQNALDASEYHFTNLCNVYAVMCKVVLRP